MPERDDPLDALRAPIVPVRPDPGFAAALRARLERAVLDPTGAAMPADSSPASGTVTVPPAPSAEGDVVYSSLWVPDVAAATAFYSAVLGWRVTEGGEGHARRVEGATPPIGLWGGIEDATLFLCHAVDDVHAAVERVRAAGGRSDEPTREPFGLVANCTDDQGLPFALLHAPAAERGEVHSSGPGRLLYLTVGVPDSARYRAFYGAVFGWTFTPGSVDDGWGVQNPRPMLGMRGGAERPAVVPMFGVPDVAAAVERVRAAGGTSGEPEKQPYGLTAECADDQGVRFYLGQI
jgi:uncharacterized protein